MDESRRRRKCSGEDSDVVSDISIDNELRSHSEQGSDCDNSDYESIEEGQLLDGDDEEIAAITANNTEQSEEEKKLDDDEDRKNPQYIPKKGTFYEHDNRNASENEDVKESPIAETSDKPDPKKKIWKEDDKWCHDKFDEADQTPRSRDDIIAIYGYDIRNEEGPPKARRTRRYGRGPNKYTRNWEDLDAYKPSRGRLSAEPRRGNSRPHNIDSETEFPTLGSTKESNGDGYNRRQGGEDSVTVPDSENTDNSSSLVDLPDSKRDIRDTKEQNYPNSGYRDNNGPFRGRGSYKRGGRGDNRNSHPRYGRENYSENSYRGRNDQDGGYRGRKDSDGGYRGRRDQDGGYRGNFRGRSDYNSGYRGRKDTAIDNSFRGKNYSDSSYGNRNNPDGSFRGRNDGGDGSYRGRGETTTSYRGRGDRENRRSSYTSSNIVEHKSDMHDVADQPKAAQPAPPKDDYRLNRPENIKTNIPPRLQKEVSPKASSGQPTDAQSKTTKRYSTQRQRAMGEPNPSFQHSYYDQERSKHSTSSKNYSQPAYTPGAAAFPTEAGYLPRVPVPQIMAPAPRPHLIAGPPLTVPTPIAGAVAVAPPALQGPAIGQSPAAATVPPYLAPENIITYGANPTGIVAAAPQFPPFQTFTTVPQATPTEIYRNGVTYYSTQNQQHPRIAPPLQKRAKAAIPIVPPPDDEYGGLKSGDDAASQEISDEVNDADSLSAPEYEDADGSDYLIYEDSLPAVDDNSYQEHEESSDCSNPALLVQEADNSLPQPEREDSSYCSNPADLAQEADDSLTRPEREVSSDCSNPAVLIQEADDSLPPPEREESLDCSKPADLVQVTDDLISTDDSPISLDCSGELYQLAKKTNAQDYSSSSNTEEDKVEADDTSKVTENSEETVSKKDDSTSYVEADNQEQLSSERITDTDCVSTTEIDAKEDSHTEEKLSTVDKPNSSPTIADSAQT